MLRVVKGLMFAAAISLAPGALCVTSSVAEAHDLTPLQQVVKDPLVSLMDGQATRNLQVAHFNALRSLSFAGLGGLSDVTASGLRASDGLDTALPAVDPIGAAMFKARVVDDLVSALDEITALTGEDYLATGNAPIYDEDAVISGIFQVDSSQWGDTWTMTVSEAVIDAGEVADPSNVTMAPDEVQVAETGGESPLESDGADTLTYAGGHYGFTPQSVNAAHGMVDTTNFNGFDFQYFGNTGQQRKAHRASVPLTSSMANFALTSLPSDSLITLKGNSTSGSSGSVTAVPLPAGGYAGAITLAGLVLMGSSRRVRTLLPLR